MKISPAYWGVRPDFLKLGSFTIDKRDMAIQWCKENCIDKFISSDLYAWAFLSKTDAENFSFQFGGELQYKPEETILC